MKVKQIILPSGLPAIELICQGAELTRCTQRVKNLLEMAYPASFKDLSSAIGQYSLIFNISGKDVNLSKDCLIGVRIFIEERDDALLKNLMTLLEAA